MEKDFVIIKSDRSRNMCRVRSRVQAELFPIGAWRHALLLAEGFGKNFGIPVTTGKSDRFDGEIRIR